MNAPPRIRVAVAVAVLSLAAPPARAAAQTAGPTISPLPGTPDASPSTQISFLGAASAQIQSVSVTGSRTAAHGGHLAAYDSGPGASFVPDRPFAPGERVHVAAQVGGRAVGTDFVVARAGRYRFNPPSPPHPIKPGTVQRFTSRADLLPPALRVTASSAAATPGDVFLAPNSGSGQYGPLIVDAQGQVVWFQPLPRGDVGMNFGVQSYEGRPALVWWQGYIADLGIGFGADEIYDSTYRQVAQVTGGNGYRADLHDVQLTGQGSALITSYALVRADLSSVGGPRRGVLVDSIVQEVDVKTGLVMFEWHADGHVAFSRSYWPLPKSAHGVWDYFHINSVSAGPDGNLLISSRNTWAGFDVSPVTGQVLWELGGRHPSFRMGTGTGTAWQHDIRWAPDGTITVFDNEATPKVRAQSRVLRERVDVAHGTVTLLGASTHSPALLAGSQGNVQLLSNGNSFVGWGSAYYASEYDPSGRLLFDLELPPPEQSYRAFRFAWTGAPASPPSVAARRGKGDTTVYVSWNGATSVVGWRVLGGASPATMTPLAQAARSGFETAIAVRAGLAAYAVQALDGAGQVIGTSPAVAAA